MGFLVLTATEVEAALPMAECIEAMAAAFLALDDGTVRQPLRSIWPVPGAKSAMAWMPAYRGGNGSVFGAKVLCVVADNPTRGLDSHQGQVLLSDGQTGQLVALLDASAVTAIRTAAVSALATRLLARDAARELAILGTGVQARRHLQAIPLVRPIERVRVAGRTPESARAFVAELAAGLPFALEACTSAEAAVRDADIVVTATSSRTPVLAREWLAPGAHVNAVGASIPPHHELDLATVRDAALFTDRRESLEHEAAEYRLALDEGLIGPSHVRGELGELLAGKVEGRTSANELTLYRSHGLAVFDVVAAEHAVATARELGLGTTVSL